MKRLFKGLWMALGMFTAIPLPFRIWDEKLMRQTIAALPLVGLIIGAIWWAGGLLLVSLAPPLVMAAAILTVLPFFAAGFIHLDGFMDTSDAMLSRRPFEDGLRILRDPAVGTFAVVSLAVLFLLQFASVHTILSGQAYFALFMAICAASRGCAAFSILALRHMPGSNYAKMLGQNSDVSYKAFALVAVCAALAASALYAGFVGLAATGAAVLGYAVAMRAAYKSFNGVSGDLLGYSIVISELCGLVALALLGGAK